MLEEAGRSGDGGVGRRAGAGMGVVLGVRAQVGLFARDFGRVVAGELAQAEAVRFRLLLFGLHALHFGDELGGGGARDARSAQLFKAGLGVADFVTIDRYEDVARRVFGHVGRAEGFDLRFLADDVEWSAAFD